MKTIFKSAVVAALILPFSACDKESVNTQTLSDSMSALNLITSVAEDDTHAPFVGQATYSFSSRMPENTMTVASSVLALPDGGSVTFTTLPIPMKSVIFAIDKDRNVEQVTFSAENATLKGADITDLKGLLTQAVYLPGDVIIEGYEFKYPGMLSRHFPILDYTLNEVWRVRTFWYDMTFCGDTQTTTSKDDKPYVTSSIRYRVVMQRGEGNRLNGKADIILYNAKFAASAPELTVIVKNLDLEFGRDGYTITGKDVVPSMISDGKQLEARAFTFNNLKFAATGDMTSATCDYVVKNGAYKGSFIGSSIMKR